MSTLEEILEKLPPELRKEVQDFAMFLLEKRNKKKIKKFLRQDWGGALKNYKNVYTSLDLQKKSLEWRGD